ncbi:MAG: hypothetical protein IJY46_09910, partial [Lentisphaeria bacterium]|nr:hypothetical protein [Lentisphaeria bacterium]
HWSPQGDTYARQLRSTGRRQYRAVNVSFFKAKLRECTTVLDPSGERRKATQHTPNQRRKAFHKPPSGALITNYLGRRKATHTPDNSAPPGGGNIAPLM